MATSSKKRSADHLDDPEQQSKKLFSIFDKPGTSKDTDASATFRWLPALGAKHTCLHGLNLAPASSTRVAAFDLDGCLIEGGFQNKAKGAPPSFQWWRPSVPAKLKEVHDAGYAIVIISNQALRSAQLADWKKKIPLIAAAVPETPFRLFAATAHDGYRKPMLGMWYELERIFAEDGVQIDKAASFFVGDAAGRQGDHSGTDRKWALNTDVPFFTPEEYFLKLPGAPYTLVGFNVSSLPKDLPHITPTSTPLLPAPSKTSKPELVVFVGFPSLGKSAFYRKHFEPAGYAHVNQDTLRTRERCVKAAKEALAAGKSCVVDNTNRDAQTRKHYVDLARSLDVPARCVVFLGSLELAWHNNLYRAYNLAPGRAAAEPARELLPYTAYTSFRAQFEEPGPGEGFSEVKKVSWVFEGSDEDRRRWSMWLQIDGK